MSDQMQSQSGGETSTQSTSQGSSTQSESYGSQQSETGSTTEGQSLGGSTTQNQSQASQARELTESDFEALVALKIDGKDHKIPVKELIKNNQLAAASYEKMKKAAEIEKNYKRLLELRKTNFDEFAKTVGMSDDEFDSIAEARLAKKFELAQMSPEQRELMQLKQEKQMREQAESQTKGQIFKEIQEVAGNLDIDPTQFSKEQLIGLLEHAKTTAAEAQANFDKEFMEAWKASGLPKHRYFGSQIAYKMLSHQKNTGNALQLSDAVAKVKNEFVSNLREVFSQMDAQAIQSALGKDLTAKLREFDVQRVTGEQAPMSQQSRPANAASESAPKTMNEYEYRSYLKKTYGI